MDDRKCISINEDKYFTKEEQSWMRENRLQYRGYRDIAEALGKPRIDLWSTRVRRFLVKHGLGLPRTKDVEHTFFDSIDTEEKAYMFGFIVTDGSLWVKGDYKYWRITLQGDDEHILLHMANMLGYKRPLAWDEAKNHFTLFVNSKEQVDALMYYGVEVNKTYEGVSSVVIPEGALFIPFLRGLVDGDGCIYFKKAVDRHYSEVELTQNYVCRDLLVRVDNILTGMYGIKAKYEIKKDSRENRMHTARLIWRHEDCVRLLELLYTDSNMHLHRKKLRADVSLRYGTKHTRSTVTPYDVVSAAYFKY